MIHKMKSRFFAICIAVLLALGGCAATDMDASGAGTRLQQAGVLSVLPESEAAPSPVYDAIAGGGTIVGEAASELSESQKQLLIDFMNRYYQSMGTLEALDCADLFASSSQAGMHQAVWSVVTGIRREALVDLTLNDYQFTLDCNSVVVQENGLVRVDTEENSVMHFAASPDADSEVFDMVHSFTLSGSEETGWKIERHMPWDSAYYPFMFAGRFAGSGAAQNMSTRADSQLSTALSNIAARQAQRQETVTAQSDAYQNSYNRQAAVEYARRWAEQRNENWAVYDRYGGNCMNYVSQAIHAGGIPMDGVGASWYWYGDGNRSPSWSGVSYFMNYAAGNSGGGMVSDADANYYTGEPGDVIAMGTDSFRHIVMISRVLMDAEGNTLDYLICSNTGNYRDFPAGAYYYTYQQLVKIYGWN